MRVAGLAKIVRFQSVTIAQKRAEFASLPVNASAKMDGAALPARNPNATKHAQTEEFALHLINVNVPLRVEM